MHRILKKFQLVKICFDGDANEGINNISRRLQYVKVFSHMEKLNEIMDTNFLLGGCEYGPNGGDRVRSE